MEIINWIEKELDDIKSDLTFKEYFDDLELEDDGVVYYLFNPDKGIDIVINKMFFVQTIHLFSGNTDDGKRFSGVIPESLSFNMSQSAVRSKFGNPNRSSIGFKDITGNVPAWDKYYLDFYSIHLQYSADKKGIDLITIASLKLEQQLNARLQ